MLINLLYEATLLLAMKKLRCSFSTHKIFIIWNNLKDAIAKIA